MEKVLQLLQENARLSNEQMAVMLNRSTQEVAAAIDEYEKQGIICGYKPLINYEKAGVERASALIELRVTPRKDTGFDAIAEHIMSFEEVESLYLMSGSYDLAVTVNARTMQDIAVFVARRLAPIEGVLSTATHFILHRYKEAGVSLQGEEIDEREGQA